MEIMDEKSFEQGERAAWLHMLRLCVHQLGVSHPEVEKIGWLLEREQVVGMLENVCERFGDLDWDSSYNLSDVIEKHLWRQLEDSCKN